MMDIMLKIAEYIPGRPFPYILSIAAYAFTLWFVIFVFTRSPRNHSCVLASSSKIILSGYYFLTILMNSTSNKNLFIIYEKAHWLTVALPSVLWLHLSIILLADELNDSIRQPIPSLNNSTSLISWIRKTVNGFFDLASATQLSGLYCFYIMSFCFIIFGPFTNLFYNYSQVDYVNWPWSKWTNFTIIPGKYYFIFSLFLSLSIGWAAINLYKIIQFTKDDPVKKNKYTWLFWGTVLFVVGAAILTLTYLETLPMPDAIGHVILALGILIVDYAIARHNALIEGRVLREKFLSDFWTLFTILTLFILIFFVVQPSTSIPALLIFITFLILTYVFYEQIRERWEKRFLDPRISSVKISTERLAAKMSEINIADVEMWLEKAKTLSEAERRIFDAIGKGLGKHGYDDISSELFVSKNTVDAHLKNIRKKLGCCKSAELPLVWLVVNFLPEQEKINKPEMIQE